MRYQVVLKSLTNPEQKIVLATDFSTKDAAEERRKNWRRVLGGKNWTVDRRPGLDTLDYLALTVEPVV